MILASKMMLEWLADRTRTRDAERLPRHRRALKETLSAGVMTSDLGGSTGTDEFGNTIARKVGA